jgi:hypothetical protein
MLLWQRIYSPATRYDFNRPITTKNRAGLSAEHNEIEISTTSERQGAGMSVLEINAAWETEQNARITRMVDECDSLLLWRRKMARQTLEKMGEDAVAPLLNLFAAENRQRDAHLRRTGPTLLFGLIASAILLILNRIGARSEALSALAAASLIVFAGGIFTGAMNGYGRRHKRLARLLATCESVAVVGALADALDFDEDGVVLFPETRRAAIRGLTRLLPRLRPEDRTLLTPSQWAHIIKVLKDGDTEFTLAVLKAWQEVGDYRALPHVRRLAHSLALTDSARRIREAAQECLTVLEARVAQEMAPQMLLRASCSTDWTPETLLRPASQGAEVNPQELLRVVSE